MSDKGQGLGQGLGLEYDDMSKARSSAAGGSGDSSCVGGSSSSSQSSSLLSAAVYQHTNPLYYRQVLMDGTTLLHTTLSRYL